MQLNQTGKIVPATVSLFAALIILAASAATTEAKSSFYGDLCSRCHSGATVENTCDGCHKHGARDFTASTDKAVYAPGEDMTVTVDGGSRGGWVRVVLYDENGTEVARSTGPAGMGGGEESSTNTGITFGLKASDSSGPHGISVAWWGYDRGQSAHGETSVTAVEYEVASADLCAGVICDDGNLCTDDVCNPDTGDCQSTSNTKACDDGNACTDNDSCVEGVCAGTSINCDDGNLCTNDSCEALTGCANTAVACSQGDTCDPADGFCKPDDPCANMNCDDSKPCTDDTCVDGTCINTNNTASCDDNQACTTGDICSNGSCSGTAVTCEFGSCDTSTGQCPGDPCANMNCDDSNPCTDDTCVDGACVNTNNTASCNDNQACTTGDICSNGSCSGAAVTCEFGSCDTSTGQCPGDPCANKNCNDNNPCTDDSCDPTSGTAVCVNAPNTMPCNDGDACTTGDICSEGSCKTGSRRSCSDSNDCTEDTCDSGTGNCMNILNCQLPECAGATDNPRCGGCTSDEGCDDGQFCNGKEACQGGQCLPGIPPQCDDGSLCNGIEYCNDVTDTCDPGAPVDCDDGNACTIDTCDANGGCAHEPVLCGDGMICQQGECVSIPPETTDISVSRISATKGVRRCRNNGVKIGIILGNPGDQPVKGTVSLLKNGKPLYAWKDINIARGKGKGMTLEYRYQLTTSDAGSIEWKAIVDVADDPNTSNNTSETRRTRISECGNPTRGSELLTAAPEAVTETVNDVSTDDGIADDESTDD